MLHILDFGDTWIDYLEELPESCMTELCLFYLILVDLLLIIVMILIRAHVSWHYLHVKFIKIKQVILDFCCTRVTLKHLTGSSWVPCSQGAKSR